MLKSSWWGDGTPDYFPDPTPLYYFALAMYFVLNLLGLQSPDWVLDQVLIPWY